MTDGHVRPFADWIREQSAGRTHDELTEALAEVVAAVKDTGKKGSLTLTIQVAPFDKGMTAALVVTDAVKKNVPQHDRRKTVFYADDAGVLSASPQYIDGDGRFVGVTIPEGGRFEVIDLHEKALALADRPDRKTGRNTVNDARSLIDYVQRHGTDDTELWADVEKRSILAVINGNSPASPGHGDHRVTLALRLTPAWKAWTTLSGQYVDQESFAEHIEARQPDVVDPQAAVLLEIAQTFKATKKADFESSKRLSDGQTVFEYRETVNASAGKKGELAVPETFTLALAPFQGSPTYKVTARLRTRTNDGTLRIGYLLDRPEEVLEAAFNDVLSDVATDLDAFPLFAGWPQQ